MVDFRGLAWLAVLSATLRMAEASAVGFVDVALAAMTRSGFLLDRDLLV